MATPSTFPLTTFELVALLSLSPGPAAEQSAASLRVAGPGTDATAQRAGLASLLVRELAEVRDGLITARGNAGGVAAVLTTATRWVEVGVARSESGDGAVLVEAPGGALLITPRGLDLWDVLPVEPGTDLVRAGVDLARRGVDVTPAEAAVAVTVKVTTASGSTVASAHRAPDGAWQLALEPADAEGRLTVQDDAPADEDEAMARLSEALR
ncbi:hypothetical protein V5D56_02060 [Cellulosimicrobium sp. PMB13]|uniref:hypothetical protein n=1 Tax=Cellulosimicrobium sp. PMB13 TaxID=3120158 RepID=UPI003F4B8D30